MRLFGVVSGRVCFWIRKIKIIYSLTQDKWYTVNVMDYWYQYVTDDKHAVRVH